MSKSFTIIHIKDGILQNRKAVKILFDSLKDGRHLIEISGADKRSNQQNRYLHGILIPEFRKALNGVGYGEVKTDEQAKLILKSMFLTREIPNEEGGKSVHYVQETHTLTKEEFSILVDEVIRFAADEMNYQIMYPNEQAMIDYD